MHLVLKSDLAHGNRSFLAYGHTIEKVVQRMARICRVRIHDIAIPSDHIHAIIQPKSRAAYRRFIRAVTGILARFFWRIGIRLRRRFWLGRPFTRIVSWGRDFTGVVRYLLKNRLDLLGMSRADSTRMIKEIVKLRVPRPSSFLRRLVGLDPPDW